jgi:hypothetical protein
MIDLHCNIDTISCLPTFTFICMEIIIFCIAYVLGLHNNIYYNKSHPWGSLSYPCSRLSSEEDQC